MKKIIIITLLILISCSKDKIKQIDTVNKAFLTAECPDTVKFETQVKPIISEWCMACHSGGGSNMPILKDYATISSNSENIIKAIKADGLPLMPKGGSALNDSLIQKISCWIQQGKLNN